MLETTNVSRSLDRKSTILWLEITDIFFVVTFCSVLNLLFGGTSVKAYFVYLPTLILTLTLILTKRGRPEKFLLHLLSFLVQPRHLCSYHDGPLEFYLTNAIEMRRREQK
jgi:hypothetical protein